MQKTSNFFRITLIYFFSLLLFVGLRIVFNLGFLSELNENLSDLISSLLIQVIVMFFVPLLFYFLLFRKKPKEVFSSLGFKKISGKVVLISFLIGLIAFALNIFISSIFNGLIEAFGYKSPFSSSTQDYSVLGFVLSVFCTAILPAVCEEFVHRGILMRGLYNSISVKHSLIISSICFGLMHLNIVQVFYATILGLLIGFVSIVGKSIWPAVIIHFTNNFVNVYLSYAYKNGWFLGNFYDVLNELLSKNYLLSFVFIILLVCVLIYFLIYLILKLLKITSYENFKSVIYSLKKSFNKDFASHSTYGEISHLDYVNDIEPIILENIQEPKDMSDLFFQDIYPKEKLYVKDLIFLICVFFLSGIITIFTFIWGLL